MSESGDIGNGLGSIGGGSGFKDFFRRYFEDQENINSEKEDLEKTSESSEE